MNSDFPPRALPLPVFDKRKPAKGQPVPLPQDLFDRRDEIARSLGLKITELDRTLRAMTPEQRRAVFYKITHEGPVDLTGTGLKPVVERGDAVTLAVPKGDNLNALNEKLNAAATAQAGPSRLVSHGDLLRIEDLIPGDPKDRLSDELFAQYDSLIEQASVICEIELMSLEQGSNKQRAEIQGALADLRTAFAAGVHGTLFEHEEHEGTCRAVIRVTGDMFRRLVEEPRWHRTIWWFEPKPRFETFQTIWQNFRVQDLAPIEPPPEDAPIVCVVDSGVTAGNPFLEPVTREDLLRSFLKADPKNPFDEFGHGSNVASLVAYYALNIAKGGTNRGRVWIASARILDANNSLEEGQLFSKVLREVVTTFKPLGVRIFNLAVSDVAKKWNPTTKRTAPRKSWVARTIDRLSREHDVVFVTCTGNLTTNAIRDYMTGTAPYPKYFCDEDCRLLDPGQAALALTIGSIVPSTLVVSSADTAIAELDHPSPFTRCGPGMRKEVKPELVEFGGNLVYDAEGKWVRSNPGTDVVMASHQISPALARSQGTSFAAPRVAHKLALIFKDLLELGVEHVSAPLLRAFVVNSSTYRGTEELIPGLSGHLSDEDRKHWMNVLGYGFPDAVRATYCDDYSMTLFYQGEIEPDHIAYFDVPVPASLAGAKGKKLLTVTVTHSPEVQKWGLERYFGTDLKWRMFRGDVNREEVTAAMSQTVSSEVDEEEEEGGGLDEPELFAEPELPNELSFDHKLNRRSRGTVQHDTYEWTQHKEAYSENHYTLAVAAFKRWNRNVENVPFAVVVRIEDLGTTAKIYTEIREILARLEVETQARQ